MELNKKMFHAVMIELQSVCNLSCWFCPRTYDTTGKYFTEDGKKVSEQMPTEKVLSILDQLQEMNFTGRVTNQHLSEPMLDKRVIDIAWEVRNRGMVPTMNTNGHVLRKDLELSREAAKVFEYIVVGIYECTTLKEVEAEKTFWQERLKGTNICFSVILPEEFSEEPSETSEEYSDKAFPRINVPYSSGMKGKDMNYPNGKCHRPFENLLIKYDGSVALCCEDYQTRFDLGNVFEKPIKEIWFSDKRLKIVSDLIEGRRHLYPLCSKCFMPPTEGPKEGDFREFY